MNERLSSAEEKLGENQFGFRKGRSCIAIYTLNFVANRKLSKKRGKLFAFFADLKAAFDKVDRIKLGEILEKAGINNQLRMRIMETYEETKNVVRIEDRCKRILDRDGS